MAMSKKARSTLFAFVVVAVVVLLVLAYEQRQLAKASGCDEISSRLVAHAYVISNPILGQENTLMPFMQSYPTYFTQDGGAIRCMQSLGARLELGGMALSNQIKGNPAMEKFGGKMPEGLENLPGQVDQNLRNVGANQFMMGQDLIWLSHVLPPAAQGNSVPYNTTTTYSRQAQMQTLTTCMMMNPGICQAMQALARTQLANMETQVYTLARQLGN